ncbi:MAG: twin-arginine translocase subunit TatC [Deltaproteobacteria bacterium]|nr:twin-arginine translocase subunit TatC [Deltaproteobacteria bacterium]
MNENAKMPFTAHLEELRKRLIICVAAVGVGFAICYGFSTQLFAFLVQPLRDVLPKGDTLVYTSLPEMFFIYLKIGFLAGALLASPIIFYQLWSFIAPGLYPNEKKYAIPFVCSSCLLFIGGAVFGYAVVFPFGFKFFVSFNTDYVKALPAVSQYFSLSIKLLLAFGVIFEMPIVILFLSKIGLVNYKMLSRKRKYAILVIFVVAAILTPPDVITQFMMAVPMLVLYEASIFLAKWFGRKPLDEESDEKEKEDTAVQKV